jgi:hypothetical protein
VLARLEELDGVTHAETDFTGDYLRLTLNDLTALTRATEMLLALGYVAEPAANVRVDHWYDENSVGDLSRVEAGVIADRVVPTLRLRHELNDDLARSLRSALVEALHRCFTENAITSQPSPSLRSSCVEATRTAASPLVGALVAEEFARVVDADMAEDHTSR